MSHKPYLVAANDTEGCLSERLAYALSRTERLLSAHERRFLVDGELLPVHLPVELWLVLDGIAHEEGLMTAHLVEIVARRGAPGQSLAAALRAFILAFHRRQD
jgi:predicted DNA-binding ribbon-helix-helix protein